MRDVGSSLVSACQFVAAGRYSLAYLRRIVTILQGKECTTRFEGNGRVDRPRLFRSDV